MPKGHRGYFFTESKKVAESFGPNISEVEITTDKIFDARKEEHIEQFMMEYKKRFPGETYSGKEKLLKRGNHAFYENTQTKFILEDLGYKGNWQLEDGKKTIRLYDKADFKITPLKEFKIKKEPKKLTKPLS